MHFFSSLSWNLIHHVPNRLSIIKCLFYFCSINLNGCQRIIMERFWGFQKRPRSFWKRLKCFLKTFKSFLKAQSLFSKYLDFWVRCIILMWFVLQFIHIENVFLYVKWMMGAIHFSRMMDCSLLIGCLKMIY